jgi:Domain of unknown function (DUF1929)/IPT/TIG domain/Glyoxal oxidase N-terminus
MKCATSMLYSRPFFLVCSLLACLQLAVGQAQTYGKWTTLPYTTPINPVHAVLLKGGNILIVAGSGNCPPTKQGCPAGPPYGPANASGAELFDPVAGKFTQFTLTWDMFCSGMVVLPDGRPFVMGGTESYGASGSTFTGLANTGTYDPTTRIFSGQQSMAQGRWYPTSIVLGDGRVLVFSGALSGDDNNGQGLSGSTNTTVEFFSVSSGWSKQYPAPASWTPPLYPRLHLLPNGNVFYSAPEASSAMFDPATQTWTLDVATTKYGARRGYGTSVLLPLTPANNYDPRVMILGGNSPATATTEIIDLGSANPQWQFGPSMSQPRIEMNATILPNGKVLAIGGSQYDEDVSSASLNADLYDPTSNTFSKAGTNAYAHLYHSVSVLLPDGRVWFAGGNPGQGTYEPHMEMYQPAYLFNANGSLATRPSITSVPAKIGYGAVFDVQTPDAASIASVVLMRNSAVTHSFNMDQRMIEMSFTVGSGSLSVTAPPNGNIAPPGYYMLFILNTQGVPSIAKMVQIPSNVSSPPVPSGINFVQVNSATTSAGASVAIPLTNPQIAGDLNVVAVMWGDTTSAVTSVTDSNGNAYTRAVGPTIGSGLQQSIYYAKNIKAGANTLTIKFSETANFPNVNVLEYSGLDINTPFDVGAAASGSGTAASSGSTITHSANELIFGAGNTANAFTGAGTKFSNRIINNYGDISEDRIVNGAGSYAATATNSSGNWIMQLAAFRGARQGSASPVPTSMSPSSGPGSGGTNVTVTGTGFASGASVSFGGIAATNVNVVSSTSITATTPAHGAGSVNLVVQNSNGLSGTLANAYTYTSSGATIRLMK